MSAKSGSKGAGGGTEKAKTEGTAHAGAKTGGKTGGKGKKKTKQTTMRR